MFIKYFHLFDEPMQMVLIQHVENQNVENENIEEQNVKKVRSSRTLISFIRVYFCGTSSFALIRAFQPYSKFESDKNPYF